MRSVQFWQESSTNAGQDANGPCFCVLWIKKRCLRALSALEQTGVMAEMFRILLAEYGEKVGGDIPNGRLWTASCCKPRRALKISVTEGLGHKPTDRMRSGGKIHLHMDGQEILLGVIVKTQCS